MDMIQLNQFNYRWKLKLRRNILKLAFPIYISVNFFASNHFFCHRKMFFSNRFHSKKLLSKRDFFRLSFRLLPVPYYANFHTLLLLFCFCHCCCNDIVLLRCETFSWFVRMSYLSCAWHSTVQRNGLSRFVSWINYVVRIFNHVLFWIGNYTFCKYANYNRFKMREPNG